jgi:ectoine hydroxylase-related dioxygenase (phytanoyl-CoA dioxygenase family)
MTEPREEFEERGYAVIRGLLSPEEAARYRAEIQELSGVGDADFGEKVFTCADGVTQNPPFWPLIYHERLLEAIRALIGPTARYTQHSDLHAHVAGPPAGPKSAGGWHRDSACREFNVGPDWDESQAPYRIVRVAIYLQTYAESHSALGVVPGSHRYEEKLDGNARRLWSRLLGAEYRFKRALWRMGLGEEPYYYHPWFHHRTRPTRWPLLTRPTDPVWFRTEPGDCLIFNQRLYHSASPIEGPKYAMYLSYAAENEHARNHVRYYRYLRKDLNYGPIPPELAARLREHDLYMEVPDPANVEGATVDWGPRDYLADLKASAR